MNTIKLSVSGIKIFKKNSIFFKVLAFFILIILLSVLVVTSVLYLYSSKVVYREVMDSYMLLLEQAKDGNDQYLSNINMIMNQLIPNSNIMSGIYIESNKAPEAILKFATINKRLFEIAASNNIISEIAIYYNKSNVIVNNNGIFEYDYYINRVRAYEDIAVKKIEDVFSTYQPFRTIGSFLTDTGKSSDRVVVFAKTLYYSLQGGYGTILITVDEEKLQNLLVESSKNNSASLYILDTEGQFITSNNPIIQYEIINKIYEEANISHKIKHTFKRKIDNQIYGLAWLKSEKTGWYYIAAIPESNILERVYVIKNIAVNGVLLTFVLALTIAYFLTGRIYKPVAALLNYLKSEEKVDFNKIKDIKKDELGYIADLLDETFCSYSELSGLMDKNRILLQEKVISDILDGKQWEKTQGVMEIAKLEMRKSIYQVVVFELEDLQLQEYHAPIMESKLEKLNILEELDIISEFLYDKNIDAYYLQKKSNIIVAIYNMDSIDENHDYLNDFIRNVIDNFSDMYDLTVTVGVGKVYRKIEKIFDSYIDALFALKYSVIKGYGTVIYADEVKGIPKNLFEYSMDMEVKLVNFVKSGNKNNAVQLIDEIIEMNMSKQGVSPEMIDNLFTLLLGTLIRIIHSMQSTTEEIFGSSFNFYFEINQYRTIKEKKNFLKGIFIKVCDHIGSNEKNKYEKTYKRILEYIEKNYTENISLDILGEKLNLSPSYISWLFKEESGENLNNYLNKIRVEKAKELLNDKQVSVKEVGELVGYSSIHTFIRVFKKYEGITPGRFKSYFL